MAEALTLQRLNDADDAGFVALLAGIYEHSPWVAERAASRRPFATLAQLKRSLVEAVTEAPREDRLALLRAHPELAGKAMVAKALTAESSHEQGKAGLTACTPDEYATLQRLNAAYNEKFGFPFMLAVRGPRGDGLSKAQIIATFARRLENHPDFEFEEALRNVHRVAELRLDDRFGHEPVLGQQAWDCAELLARHSDPGFAENGQLTVTYLTDAHRACQAQLVRWMKECGFDEVEIDAVGNVVGVYREDPHPGPLPRAGEERSGCSPARTSTPCATAASTTAASASSCRWSACASCTAPAAGCRSRSRWSASPRRKASATRRPSSARAR